LNFDVTARALHALAHKQESNPGDRDLGKENLNGLNPSALLDSQKSTRCCKIKINEHYTGGVDSYLIYPSNYAIKDNSSCVTAFHVRDKGDIS